MDTKHFQSTMQDTGKERGNRATSCWSNLILWNKSLPLGRDMKLVAYLLFRVNYTHANKWAWCKIMEFLQTFITPLEHNVFAALSLRERKGVGRATW